jgi:hypothetical protein
VAVQLPQTAQNAQWCLEAKSVSTRGCGGTSDSIWVLSASKAGQGTAADDGLSVAADHRLRGRRHPLAGLLAVGIAAVIAGSRSFAAIGQWAADAGPEVVAVLGAARGPADESTVNPGCRVLGAKSGYIVCAARAQATVPATSVSTNAATMIATRA